jgi:hypothetical protein
MLSFPVTANKGFYLPLKLLFRYFLKSWPKSDLSDSCYVAILGRVEYKDFL